MRKRERSGTGLWSWTKASLGPSAGSEGLRHFALYLLYLASLALFFALASPLGALLPLLALGVWASGGRGGGLLLGSLALGLTALLLFGNLFTGLLQGEEKGGLLAIPGLILSTASARFLLAWALVQEGPGEKWRRGYAEVALLLSPIALAPFLVLLAPVLFPSLLRRKGG